MKKTILTTAIIFSFTMYHFTSAQISKACISIGGSGNDFGNMVRQTADSGYVAIGYTASFGVTVDDFYIVKLDKNGNLQWTKTMGGFDADAATAIDQTSDGGYVFGGYTPSFGAGFSDSYVAKLDASGNLQWGKAIGGNGNESASGIQQTSDGGYVLGGQTTSFGAGSSDFYIVKLDTGGNLQWSKAIGGSAAEGANSIQQTADGGYVMTGVTNEFGTGNDVYVVKLNSSGNLQWTKTIGGAGEETGNSIQQTTDGGYAIAGVTNSFGAGFDAVYVIRLDSSGNIMWTKTVGGTGGDAGTSIQQTADGGYVVGGYTGSFQFANNDVYVVKLDANGNLQWGSATGGFGDDFGYSIQQTADGGYVVGGISASFGAGGFDYLLIKLDASGNSCCSVGTGGTVGSGGTESSGGVVTDVSSVVTATTVADTSGEGTFTATCLITAVNDVPHSNSFSIYPNPNPGNFEVMLPNGFNNATLFVTDLVGRIIYRKEIANLQKQNPIQISLPATITAGIYFLKLKDEQGESNRELIICR